MNHLSYKGLCPCCSNEQYDNCCKPFHLGSLPKNALSLMRSRYSAYFFHLADYIVDTTHPNNTQYKKNQQNWKKEIIFFCENTSFEKLEILDFSENKTIAYVSFIAHLKQQERLVPLKEKSTFEKVDNKWLYLHGEIYPT